MAELPKPGVYPGTSWETYSSWPACRSSYLKHFKRSAAHARIAMLEPEEPTRTMALGSALHAAILEPDAFEKQYVQGQAFGDQRSPANKAARLAFEAEHAGKMVLSPDEWEMVERVSEAVWNEPDVAAILSSPGSRELSAVWRDAELGVDCKLRVDHLGSYEGFGAIVDLKSATDASQDAFQRSVGNYDYDLQAALYLDGLETLSPHPRRFVWIVFEKKPPYGVAIYEPDQDRLAKGRREYKAALAAHAECVRTGYWPGYPRGCRLLGLKPWEKPASRTEGTDDLF